MKMEVRPKPPTVFPLTGDLLEQLQRSLVQQQRQGKLQGQAGVRQVSLNLTQPERATQAQAVPHQSIPQKGQVPPQPMAQQGQARLNPTQVAQQHHNGQGAHTAIYLQVNTAKPFVPQTQPGKASTSNYS